MEENNSGNTDLETDLLLTVNWRSRGQVVVNVRFSIRKIEFFPLAHASVLVDN